MRANDAAVTRCHRCGGWRYAQRTCQTCRILEARAAGQLPWLEHARG